MGNKGDRFVLQRRKHGQGGDFSLTLCLRESRELILTFSFAFGLRKAYLTFPVTFGNGKEEYRR